MWLVSGIARPAAGPRGWRSAGQPSDFPGGGSILEVGDWWLGLGDRVGPEVEGGVGRFSGHRVFPYVHPVSGSSRRAVGSRGWRSAGGFSGFPVGGCLELAIGGWVLGIVRGRGWEVGRFLGRTCPSLTFSGRIYAVTARRCFARGIGREHQKAPLPGRRGAEAGKRVGCAGDRRFRKPFRRRP